MIEELVKISIFEKISASKKIRFFFIKTLYQKSMYYQKCYCFEHHFKNISKKAVWKLQVDRFDYAVLEKFSSLMLKTVFRENAFKILKIDYTGLKNTYKNAHMSKTIYWINFKFLENIFIYM